MKEKVVIIGVGSNAEKTFVESELSKRDIKDVNVLVTDNEPMKIKAPIPEIELTINPIESYISEQYVHGRTVKPGSKAERNELNRRKFRR